MKALPAASEAVSNAWAPGRLTLAGARHEPAPAVRNLTIVANSVQGHRWGPRNLGRITAVIDP